MIQLVQNCIEACFRYKYDDILRKHISPSDSVNQLYNSGNSEVEFGLIGDVVAALLHSKRCATSYSSWLASREHRRPKRLTILWATFLETLRYLDAIDISVSTTLNRGAALFNNIMRMASHEALNTFQLELN